MNQRSLGKDIGYLIDLPHRGGSGKACKVVNVMAKVMRDALLRGEIIHVPGFGTFRPKVLKPRTLAVYTWYQGKRSTDYVLRELPARTVIRFHPAASLVRYVNGKS